MESYNIVFVDDESIVREGIKTRIPWGENGFILTGVFENGKDALSFIKNNKTDVVISDINMPRMDGLELCRILYSEYPSITLILLTGYDEFEYAQSAISYKVKEFLLKPITADELSEVLERTRLDLDKREERERERELLLEKLALSFPLLKERFLYQLVSGKIDSGDIDKRKSFFQWEDLGGFYQVAVVTISAECEQIDSFALRNYTENIITVPDVSFSDKDGSLVLLLQDKNAAALAGKTRAAIEQIFGKGESLSLSGVCIGYGETTDDKAGIVDSYRNACAAADYARVLGISGIISIDDIRGKEKISLSSFYVLEVRFIKSLREGSREQTHNALADIFSFLKSHVVSQEEASYYFMRIHGAFYTFISEMNFFPLPIDLFTFPHDGFESFSSAEDYFKNQLNILADKIHERRLDAVVSRIEKAKSIIEKRYMEKTFSLQDMCDEMFLSTSQFSVVFKEGTGRTFVEYLTETRMEKAKELLKTTDMKSYEIAEAVGYGDPRYFSIIFKKYTGQTPMEFRRRFE